MKYRGAYPLTRDGVQGLRDVPPELHPPLGLVLIFFAFFSRLVADRGAEEQNGKSGAL